MRRKVQGRREKDHSRRCYQMWIIPGKNVPALWLVCHIRVGVLEGGLWTSKQNSAKPGREWGMKVVLFLEQCFWDVRGSLGRGLAGPGVPAQRAEQRVLKTNSFASQLCLRLSEDLWETFPSSPCLIQGTQMFWFRRNRPFPLDILPQIFFTCSPQALFPTYTPPLTICPPHFLLCLAKLFLFAKLLTLYLFYYCFSWGTFLNLPGLATGFYPFTLFSLGAKQSKTASPTERSSVFSRWICLLNCESIMHGGHFSLLHEGPGQGVLPAVI